MRLLRNRDLRIIVLVYGLSSLGDYLALIALTLRVKELTEAPIAVSALLLAGIVPLVVLAPLTGWLVDRFETVRLLVFTALAQSGLALGLVWAEDLALIVVLFFLLSSGFALAQPAIFAVTPRVVGEDRTTEANAYLEVSRWTGATIGPVAAGLISGVWGPGFALLANAVTFIVVAAAVPFLRVRRPGPEGEAEEGPARARDGVVFLRRDALLRLVVLAIAAMVVFAAIDNVAEVFFAKDVLDAGDIGYGLMVTSWTAGMVLGGTVIGRRLRDDQLAPSVLVAALVGGLSLAIAALFPNLLLAMGAFLLGGAANAVELVGLRSLIHRRVPDRLRGRVFAAYYAAVNGAQIAAMGLGGLTVAGLGARGSLLLGGGGTLAAGAIGLALLSRLTLKGKAARPTYSTSVS